ncbi:winged helix-turn-helix domain-containing protein [Sodalis glossinidius]|uniref:winged helix-turn-helix domain-containing protein n=1 Tax=Sodalis glossinidius TaxID=63612 RepID=UPI0002E91D26|nr:winged helix-turn-helix domain-containing protein [Sodalis glossinidius]
MLKKYIINDIIEFNADECVLVYIHTGDVTPLTLSTSRLLEYFVNSGGIILTRESLLENVWSKYGLTASGNNLNQYVSVLRRTLAGLGINNFIDTLPKVGFKLNPGVTITLPSDGEIAEHMPLVDHEKLSVVD